MSIRQSTNEREKIQLSALMSSLEPFRELKATMPLQYVTSFLLVALDEGQSVTEYARRAGVAQSVMTRHLLDLGESNRYREEGFGLIDSRPDPLDRRAHLAVLSQKGKGFVGKLVRALEARSK